jgi:hypothetical protein
VIEHDDYDFDLEKYVILYYLVAKPARLFIQLSGSLTGGPVAKGDLPYFQKNPENLIKSVE